METASKNAVTPAFLAVTGVFAAGRIGLQCGVQSQIQTYHRLWVKKVLEVFASFSLERFEVHQCSRARFDVYVFCDQIVRGCVCVWACMLCVHNLQHVPCLQVTVCQS